MILERVIAGRLASGAGTISSLGTIGQTIFIRSMPSEVPQGILVKSHLSGIPINMELPNYYRAPMQIIVRSPEHETGQPIADNALALMTIQQPIQLVDSVTSARILIKQMIPATLPIVFPRQDGNGIEWSINFDISLVAIDSKL